MATRIDLDSSDYEDLGENEPDRSLFKPNPNLGRRAIDTIIANQAVDRPLSKKNARELTFASGAPGTRIAQQSVAAVWDAYCETINHDVKQVPTGEQIFRFIDTRARRLRPRGRDQSVPMLATVRSIWRHLIDLLLFRHEHLKQHYTTYTVTRINTHLDQLATQGQLMRGQFRTRQWMGFRVVRRLCEAWIQKARDEGCTSWDRVLLKLLGILLQSSCAARAGDIALSSAYKGRECLCWRHVTITIADREKPLSVQNLLLKFELEFTKGHKNASNESRVVYITPLQDPSLNAVCVVKALLVVALRLGRVNYTTLDEVLYEASQRFDGTVQWKDPQAPVLCQLPYGDSSRFVGLAARPEQIRSALRELSLNAGLLARVNTHDLRSGALRDIAHLDAIPKGVADSTTTLIAGHSSNTMAKGITQEYVGHMQQPIWNLRAESSFQSRLDPSFAPAPMSKAKMPRGEVDAYLDLHEGDKGDVGARNRASASLRRDKHNTFIQETKASSVQMPSPKAQPLRKRTASQMNIEAGLQESRKKPKIADDAAKGNSLSARALSMEKQDQDTDNIDPELLDMDEGQRRDLEYIEGLIVHDATDQDSASALREADDNMVITELTDEMPTAVEQDPDDFVKWLSTINVFSGKDFRSTIQQLPTGNSLEAPTVFLHACSKCDYSTADRKYRDAHELHCTGTLPSARLRCEYEGCGKTYKNKRSLQTHVRNGHKFTPQACTRCPDDKKDEIFTSNNDLLNHVRQCHRNVDVDEPILCPYQGEDGCTMSNPFAHAESLGSHLQRIHKKSPTDIASAKRATGASSMERWQATCPVPTCTDDTIFTEAAGFTSHLCNAHHFAYKSEDVKMYLAQVRGRTSS